MLGRLYVKRISIAIIANLVLVSLTILIILLMNADLILDLLAKDKTLSGRTEFWPYVIKEILDKPILGWGFCAFWSPVNPVASQISYMVRGDNWNTFVVANAHNGLLEFLLEIGFAGTTLFLFLFLRNFVLAVKCLHGPAGQIGVSSVLLLITILIVGVSEDVLLSAGQIWTGLFFSMGFMCEKQLWLARAARRQIGTLGQRRRRPGAMIAANYGIRVP
jgi:O-antigen ligase